MGNRWIILALLAAMCVAPAHHARAAEATPPPASADRRATAVVPLHGMVDQFSVSMVIKRFREAVDAGAQTVILDLNTDGGLVSSAMELSRFLKSQGNTHTIAYISERAYSAGALIAVACNEIVMAPTAAIGDCAPIMMSPHGLQSLGAVEREKQESPIRSEMRDSALRNGYDPLLLESMVTLGRAVYYIEKADQRRFVDEDTYKQLKEEGWTDVQGVPTPLDSASTLLTLNSDLARKVGLSSEVHPTREQLAAARSLDIVAIYKTTTAQLFVDVLGSTPARIILLVVFLTALYAAFHIPGHGAPESIAVVSLVLLLGVPMLTGHGQWYEVMAIFLGIALLAIEIFFLPGFGVPGLVGLLLLFLGFLMTFVAPEPGRSPISLPSLPITWAAIQQGLLVSVAGLAGAMLLSAWLRKYLPRLPLARRLILETSVGSSDSAMAGSLTNIDPYTLTPGVGAHCTAVTDLRPGGTAEFLDSAGTAHVVSVVSDSGFVQRGSTLKVVEASGARIVVRPLPPDQEEQA